MNIYHPKLLDWTWKINIPRYFVILFDLFLAIISLSIAILLRFNFENIPDADKKNLPYNILIIILVRLTCELLFGIHKGMFRHSSSRDALRIFYASILGNISIFMINFFWLFAYSHFVFPTSVIIIDLLVYVFLMVSARIIVKTLYIEYKNPYKNKKYILIYGAGESGIITKRTLDKDAASHYKVIAFIDDDEKKQGKRIENIMVYPPEDIEAIVKDKNIDAIVISIQNLSFEKKQEIAEKALNMNIQILHVPPVSKWLNGQLNAYQIKAIHIEDLLERETINLNNPKVKEEITNKVILITGAAGSIGSELSRQCAHYAPEKLVFLDITETPLYELELEIKEKFPHLNFEIVIGDIKNEIRMRRVFEYFRPDIVFHAAAYKHVPVMEENPSEALLNNVMGTKIIADLCEKYSIEKMILISTDKAVNPTNVMGASKRIAEIYIQTKNKHSSTKYITTRFGNVLGSNGSVIVRFKKQIENGEPVTVTHPEITRFFMTIPEACQLVLEASTMGKGGEIFVFDMGKPIKILDLAKKMIRLSGLKENEDIKIKFTGLRPGEKLYEEILADAETNIPTHHPKILIGKVREYDNFEEIKIAIDELINAFYTQDNFLIVQQMKKLVPEFSSNNSVFEQLDKK